MRSHSAHSDWRQPPLVITSAGNAVSALPVRDKTPHQLSAGVCIARTGPTEGTGTTGAAVKEAGAGTKLGAGAGEGKEASGFFLAK